VSSKSSSSKLSKADEELWSHAEDIFQRYKRQEFEIDEVKGKAFMTKTYSKPESDFWGRQRDKEHKETMFLCDVFATSIRDWELDRGDFYSWRVSAIHLIHSYNEVRMNNAEVPGKPYRKQLEEKDGQIKKLTEELETTRLKLSQTEKRFSDCREANLDYEKKLREYQQQKDDQRKEDMLRSLIDNKGANAPTESGTEEDKGGEEK